MADELASFQSRIRKVWHNNEWWLSVVDVVGVLSDAANPRSYWADMKRRVQAEGFVQLLAKCKQLKAVSADHKMRSTDFARDGVVLAIARYLRPYTVQRPERGCVYAIQPTTGGLVKIEYTTKDVPRRLGQLQQMCPVPLRVIWHKTATHADEERLHAAFANCRQYGEWFHLEGMEVPRELDRALADQTSREVRAS